MGRVRSGDYLTRALLAFGVAVPFVYYGIQVAAAPFFPGFSFVGTTASELGSDLSRRPGVLNGGIMAMGAASLLASVGFFRAGRRVGMNFVLTALAAAAVAMNGVQTLWAGYHPMPDPRHGGHPAFIVAMLLLPLLLTALLWRGASTPLKAYLIATLLLLACMVPVMSGISGIDTQAYRGLQQRVFTMCIFPPIGVGGWVLMRRVSDAARAM